jgi:hypothetical protein
VQVSSWEGESFPCAKIRLDNWCRFPHYEGEIARLDIWYRNPSGNGENFPSARIRLDNWYRFSCWEGESFPWSWIKGIIGTRVLL